MDEQVGEARGLSPPTRGNPIWGTRREGLTRSIPAHAGEPAGGVVQPVVRDVYPRPRGGTRIGESARCGRRGLSPPTRGNPGRRPYRLGFRGSIPAHAGEPSFSLRPPLGEKVYPRPRGGTALPLPLTAVDWGLSPPTRGNPKRGKKIMAYIGSIPAHAGEPSTAAGSQYACRVYPRPRGGTRVKLDAADRPRGLSPPTRGNLARTACRAGRAGGWGLSPPTRGNPPVCRCLDSGIRSIPAHAGEPGFVGGSVVSDEVYPRPRGGTRAAGAAARGRRGLSPPTRGNHGFAVHVDDDHRSIPAHAGEPPRRAPERPSGRVYPRPRGGTVCRAVSGAAVVGLSPPTRGNLLPRLRRDRLRRSIPAHAGEPPQTEMVRLRLGVYPRPRGGTLIRAAD